MKTSSDGPAARRSPGPSRNQGNVMIHQDIKAAPAASLSCLFIGRDRAGHWVVKDARSLCGGLFANRTEAIRFAPKPRTTSPEMMEPFLRPETPTQAFIPPIAPDSRHSFARRTRNIAMSVCIAIARPPTAPSPFSKGRMVSLSGKPQIQRLAPTQEPTHRPRDCLPTEHERGDHS